MVLTKGEKACSTVVNSLIHFIFVIITTVSWVPVALSVPFGESYYPECNRKCLARRIWDNLCWVIRYQRANTFYNMYGLDLKNKDASNYIDEKGFWKGLKKSNYNGPTLTSQVPVLRDKLLFYRFMKSVGMPVPDVFAVLKDGELYSAEMQKIEMDSLSKKMDTL